MAEIIEKINGVVWGFPTIALLVGCGIFLSFILRFFQFSKLSLWLNNTLFSLFKKDTRKKDDSKNISQFQAISTALAATIGTGNIAGVATAISAGGPGAVFWMWISACFGMMTSYSENCLGIYYREKNSDGEWCGGPMYYMQNGLSQKRRFKKIARPMAVIYALLLIGASFGIGNMTQANSIADSLDSSFGLSVWAVGAVLAIVTFIVLSGGVGRIGRVTERLVPFMALFYIAATMFIFLSNYKSIPYVFSCIFSNAFSFKSVFGAAGGIAAKKCISFGFRRGVFSNEAGLGASVTVNSCANVKEPAKQGMWGIFQVFTDTIIVCTMTAFVLLSTSVDAVPLSRALKNPSNKTQYVYIGNENEIKNGEVMLSDINANPVPKISVSPNKSADGKVIFEVTQSGEYSYTNVMALTTITDKSGNITNMSLKSVSGVSLVTLAFSRRFGNAAGILLTVAIVLFAFSTIIGWSFYAVKATEFLFGKKGKKFCKVLNTIFVFIGSVTNLSVVWGVSDIFNALMAIPNVITLIALSGTVKKITRDYLRKKQKTKFLT